MRLNLRTAPLFLLLFPASFAASSCSLAAPSLSASSSGNNGSSSGQSGPIGASPNVFATQGVAINGNQAAYTSSNASLSAFHADWSPLWTNKNALAALPASVTHIGDIAYYNGMIFAPVENFTGCNSFAPVLLAVYDAGDGSLLTYSDITADGHEASSVTVVPEWNQLVVSSFCNVNHGFITLWRYDLDSLIDNPAGSVLRASTTFSLSAPIPAIQGISWNSALGQFLVSADIGGTAGSLWYASGTGAVSGPAFTVPVSQGSELEGLDFSTGNIYYLENGAVHAIGAPAAAPLFSIPSGSYSAAQTIVISDATPGAVIYYTTDGSMPATSSPVYSGPITVSTTRTLKAFAAVDGSASSPVASATYTIDSQSSNSYSRRSRNSSAYNAKQKPAKNKRCAATRTPCFQILPASKSFSDP